ncbi:MAG: cache domain-containing protein [Myxococcota bacterium]
MPHLGTMLRVLAAAACLVGMAACEEDTAEGARARIRETHLPRLQQVVREDVQRHLQGIRKAAERLAPGFAVDDAREQQMRTALKFVQEPPKGIAELITSPISFLAAVGGDGMVIARDADPDRMKGMDMADAFPVVRAALDEGEVGHALGRFQGEDEEQVSWSILFAAPVTHDGERVGAVVAGIPLWRLAQRLSRQMRVEHAQEIEQGLVLWAYVLWEGRLHHMGTPPELDEALPSGAELQKRWDADPDAVEGHVQLHGRTYGYAMAPLSTVGEGVGLLVVRADPP